MRTKNKVPYIYSNLQIQIHNGHCWAMNQQFIVIQTATYILTLMSSSDLGCGMLSTCLSPVFYRKIFSLRNNLFFNDEIYICYLSFELNSFIFSLVQSSCDTSNRISAATCDRSSGKYWINVVLKYIYFQKDTYWLLPSTQTLERVKDNFESMQSVAFIFYQY